MTAKTMVCCEQTEYRPRRRCCARCKENRIGTDDGIEVRSNGIRTGVYHMVMDALSI